MGPAKVLRTLGLLAEVATRSPGRIDACCALFEHSPLRVERSIGQLTGKAQVQRS